MIIVYQLKDQPLAIITPTKEGLDKLGIDGIVKRRVPEGAEYKIIKEDELINDRYFRNAWELKNGKIIENLDKAKEIHKEKLREERKPLLEKLDVDYMRALERNEETKFIISEKTRLRQITDKVNSCETLEDIRKVKILVI